MTTFTKMSTPQAIHGPSTQDGPPKQYPPTHNSLHPSTLSKLDPEFIKLYNNVIAHWPPPSTDIHIVRQNYSNLYRFATNPASGVGGIGETQVPGWSKYPGDINVRVYVPPGEEVGERKVWPVHFNFHGGGKHTLLYTQHAELIMYLCRLGSRRPRNQRPHLPPHLCPHALLRHRRRVPSHSRVPLPHRNHGWLDCRRTYTSESQDFLYRS